MKTEMCSKIKWRKTDYCWLKFFCVMLIAGCAESAKDENYIADSDVQILNRNQSDAEDNEFDSSMNIDTSTETEDWSTDISDRVEIDKEFLLNKIFVAFEYEIEDEIVDVVEGTRLSISFSETSNSSSELELSAATGCNALYIPFIFENGRIIVDTIRFNSNVCQSEDLNSQEQFTKGFMASDPFVTVVDDSVILLSELDGKTVRIEYVDIDVAFPVVGTVWEAYGVNFLYTYWESPAVMNFHSDGTLAFFSGCNDGSASYVLEGTEIVFSNFFIETSSCVDNNAERHENAIIGIVNSDSSSTLEIVEDRMHLFGESDDLVLIGSIN